MSRFDSLIERVTHGLRGDRELRLEVSQELRGHLEERMEECVAGGMNETEAQEHAVKVFGDEEKLAGELARANLRRMKVRAVVKWVGRLVLPPVAVVVLVLMMGNYAADFKALQDPYADSVVNEVMLEKLDAESRLIVQPGITNELEDIRLLSERYPEDVVYHAYYTLGLLSQVKDDASVKELRNKYDPGLPKADINITQCQQLSSRVQQSESYQDLMAAIDRGKKLEPENALYQYIRAWALAMVSSRLYEDSENMLQRYQHVVNHGQDQWETKEVPITRTLVFDDELFAQAIAAFEKGLGQPYYRSYAMMVADRQLDRLPKASNLGEYLSQTFVIWGKHLPDLSVLRDFARTVDGVAMSSVVEGDLEQALRLAKQYQLMGYKMAAESDFAISVYVGQSISKLSSTIMQDIYRHQGMDEEADNVARQYMEHIAFLRSEIWGRNDSAYEAWKQEIKLQGGMVLDEIAVSFKGYQYDLTPYRRMEYTIADHAGVMMMSGGLLLMTVFVLSWMGLNVLHWRREGDWPVMIFVGWRKVLKVIGLGVVVPAGVYMLYSMSPLSGRGYGLDYTFSRLVIEYLILMCVVGWLVNVLAKQAILQRAGEIGLADAVGGNTKTVRWKWSLCMLGLMVIGLVIVRWQDNLMIHHVAMGTEEDFKCHRGSWKEFAHFITGLGLLLMVLGPAVKNCWPKVKKDESPSRCKLSGYGLLLGMVYVLFIPFWGLATLLVSIHYYDKPEERVMAALGGVVCLVVLILVIRGIRNYVRLPKLDLFFPMAVNGSVSRSMVPILLIVAVIIGGVGRVGLGRYHQMQVEQMPMLAKQELTHTNVKLLKERLAAEHEAAMGERR